jgi:hypothetical protein
MYEHRAIALVVEELRCEGRFEHRRGTRVAVALGPVRLVGDQLRLQHEVDLPVERLDLVDDRRERPVHERHHPRRADPHPTVRRRLPLDAPVQHARLQVERPLVRDQRAVPDVERLVVDEEADDLAVGDVDDRLPRLRVAISGLGVGERDGLEDRVQIGPEERVRLSPVAVGAPADVPVGQGEDRFGLRHEISLEARLRHRPWVAPEGVVADHLCMSSERSLTTMSAPCFRSASRWPTRSTPTTRPNRPARPAATPASASS